MSLDFYVHDNVGIATILKVIFKSTIIFKNTGDRVIFSPLMYYTNM